MSFLLFSLLWDWDAEIWQNEYGASCFSTIIRREDDIF